MNSSIAVLESAITLIQGSYEDRREKIQAALKEQFADKDTWVWTKATFAASVIWEKESTDKAAEVFISTYSFTEEGDVEILSTKEIELVTGYQIAAEQWIQETYGSKEKAMTALVEAEAPANYKSIVGALMLLGPKEVKETKDLDADVIWKDFFSNKK